MFVLARLCYLVTIIINVTVLFIVLIHLVGVASILIPPLPKVFVVITIVKLYLAIIIFHLAVSFMMQPLINVLIKIVVVTWLGRFNFS